MSPLGTCCIHLWPAENRAHKQQRVPEPYPSKGQGQSSTWPPQKSAVRVGGETVHWPSFLPPHWSAKHSATWHLIKRESQMSRKLHKRTYWQYWNTYQNYSFQIKELLWRREINRSQNFWNVMKETHLENQFDCTHLIRSMSISEEIEWIIHCEMCLETIC